MHCDGNAFADRRLRGWSSDQHQPSFIFGRNFARDGVIAIDGVYSNPAGVAFFG